MNESINWNYLEKFVYPLYYQIINFIMAQVNKKQINRNLTHIYHNSTHGHVVSQDYFGEQHTYVDVHVPCTCMYVQRNSLLSLQFRSGQKFTMRPALYHEISL